MSNLKEMRMATKTGYLSSNEGIGRSCNKGSCFDKFVMTRKAINLPELIFNQNSHYDY